MWVLGSQILLSQIHMPTWGNPVRGELEASDKAVEQSAFRRSVVIRMTSGVKSC